MLGQHASFGGISMSRSVFSCDTLICGLARSTPIYFLRTMVARWSFVLVFVWLGHRIISNHVKPCWGTSRVKILPGFTETGSFTYKSRTFVHNRACLRRETHF